MKWKPLLAHIFPGEQIVTTQALAGGCINYCYKIVTNKQAYFVKFNNAQRFPKMYACEAFGLTTLAFTKAVNVPEVLKQAEVEDMTFLVLEYIEPGSTSTKALTQLGHDLASMHKNTQTQSQSQFGWEHDNFIGSLTQSNAWNDDWFMFYEEQRVVQLCKKLVHDETFDLNDLKQAKQYLANCRDEIPIELPSLIHGDLWSGNFLIGKNDKPYLIDPACYYGHREMDIAMTQLFGGFGHDFIDAYENTFPLQQGWRNRIECFQLYPLLVHAVIFGGGYIDKVRNIIHQGA
jgi:protein-ribulosamine 3-kinase